MIVVHNHASDQTIMLLAQYDKSMVLCNKKAKAYLLTHTPRQGGTPHPSPPTQAGYLVFPFQTVARETGKNERVSNPKLEAHPSTVGRYSGILTRLQIILCQRRNNEENISL